MRISRILSLQHKTFFFLLIYVHMLSRKTQYVARQYIKNRLDYYLMIYLNMNYGFCFLNHLNRSCFYQY